MTRQERIFALARQMLKTDNPRRGLSASSLDPSFIAAVIDSLPPERFADQDRDRIKLNFLLRSLGVDPP